MKTTTLMSSALLALSVGIVSAQNKTETLSSGVKIEHLKEGSGASPTAADTVVAHYRGTLPDGKEFDSSYKQGVVSQGAEKLGCHDGVKTAFHA